MLMEDVFIHTGQLDQNECQKYNESMDQSFMSKVMYMYVKAYKHLPITKMDNLKIKILLCVCMKTHRPSYRLTITIVLAMQED